MKNRSKKGGYALLFTITVAGIILIIGTSIVNIVRKEILLSGTARESQFSFYAADAGIECALLWDIRHPWSPNFDVTVFATSNIVGNYEHIPGAGQGATCDGDDINPFGNITEQTPTSATTEFNLVFSDDTCANVTVQKINQGARTVIDARGYNTCDLSSPRRVERALRVTY